MVVKQHLLVCSSRQLYFVDSANPRIRVVDVKLATCFNLNIGHGLWVDSVGNIFYSDCTAKYVREITLDYVGKSDLHFRNDECTFFPAPSLQPSSYPTIQP